jgi:hypothetical protein
MAKYRPKQIAIGMISALAIAGAIAAIYFQTRPPGINVPLHRTMGEVLAEQAASITNKGKIVVITIDGNAFPEIKAQMEGFEKALEKFPGLKLYRTVEVETEGKPKYGPGRGLSEERFLRIMNKYSERAQIVISLIGSPELKEDQFEKVPKRMPKFIAETRGRDELAALFAAGVIHAAVVPRFVFPAPVEKPRTAREWFDNYWQVINPSTVADDDEIPKKKQEKNRQGIVKP